MMQNPSVGFIGSGNMAYAISGKMDPDSVYLYDVQPEHYVRFEARGSHGLLDMKSLIARCDFIFLSIKPQNFEEVLKEVQTIPDCGRPVYVSIAAGISISYIASYLGQDTKIVRAMPNTPLLIGKGCTALCSKNVPDEALQTAKSFFETAGIVEIIPEDKMNEVIALNGSSPAYVYYFLEALVDGAVAYGFDRETAKKMACATVKGAVDMVLESEADIPELINMVCSKGGTTIAAMDVLRDNGFKETLISAMDACTRRAEEMGR